MVKLYFLDQRILDPERLCWETKIIFAWKIDVVSQPNRSQPNIR